MNTPLELFGVECEKGWYPLVKRAIAAVARYNGINRPDPDFGPVELVQIKEKRGGLCLYLNYYPSRELERELRDIEHESYGICEFCGSTENVSTKESHGWIFTLCNKCRRKEEIDWAVRMGKPITIKVANLGKGSDGSVIDRKVFENYINTHKKDMYEGRVIGEISHGEVREFVPLGEMSHQMTDLKIYDNAVLMDIKVSDKIPNGKIAAELLARDLLKPAPVYRKTEDGSLELLKIDLVPNYENMAK